MSSSLLLDALTSPEINKAILVRLDMPRQHAERNTLFWCILIMHYVSEAGTELIWMTIDWRDTGSVRNIFSMSLECSLTLQGIISLE
jgi:hypothetical protein